MPLIRPLKIRNKVFSFEKEDIPYFMGVLNVTPDSFSDGGLFTSVDKALKQVQKLIEDGADLIDVGGESTRPFAEPVSEEEELKRIIPVIKEIREIFPEIPISIDTYKSRVAEEALKAGADIINDVSACRLDPEMVNVAKEFNCPIIIMHMKGTPKNMQLDPIYGNVVEEIKEFLKKQIDFLVEKGVDFHKIIIDPGIGFGKKFEHNIQILRNIESFLKLERPILVGHSRKRFIEKIIPKPPIERDFATSGVSVYLAMKGVHFLRVHNVVCNKDSVKMFKFLWNQQVKDS